MCWGIMLSAITTNTTLSSFYVLHIFHCILMGNKTLLCIQTNINTLWSQVKPFSFSQQKKSKANLQIFNPLPDDKILDMSKLRQNFRHVQIETNCRQHLKVQSKWKISAIQARKHCVKRRNCLLQAISPFLTIFHNYISLVHQNVALCGNGLNLLYCKGLYRQQWPAQNVGQMIEFLFGKVDWLTELVFIYHRHWAMPPSKLIVLVICKLFQFGRVKNLLFGNGLTHSHMKKFRPDQLESICRQQIKCNKKWSFLSLIE